MATVISWVAEETVIKAMETSKAEKSLGITLSNGGAYRKLVFLCGGNANLYEKFVNGSFSADELVIVVPPEKRTASKGPRGRPPRQPATLEERQASWTKVPAEFLPQVQDGVTKYAVVAN